MKNIPYGIINYKTLIEENYIYVDKTMYLSKLENEKKTLMYLKPGRFGKSLFTSMMYYYYDINSSNEFETLFKDTYVYDNPTPNKNNYYVLKFDFSGINSANKSKEVLENKFKSCVIQGIESFMSRYDINYNLDYNIDADVMIKLFLSHFESLKLEHKIYVIVDEYDNFTNELLEGDTGVFTELVGKDGIVKAFYANIKLYVKENSLVDRFFATGICPITLNSMTTGFNIATDISTYSEFNSMIGLTHDEVKSLFKELEISEGEQNTIFQVMLKNYDGYRFNEEKEERVFNATLVMYFLSKYVENHEIPKKLYDNNIVVNYGKIENLLKLQNNTFYKDIISDILDNSEIIGRLKTQFNLEEDFTRDDILSLLYYFGYLTIKDTDITGDIIYKIPNYIMKETYGNYFLKLIRDEDVVIDTLKINESLREIILEGNIEKITNYISEILKLLDNRMFIKFDEKYIQELYFALLVSNPVVSVYTEYPLNGGYADIYMMGKREKLEHDILIEVKYIKKSDYNEEIYKVKYNEALNEIDKYIKDPRIDKNILKKYIVIFVGNEVKLLESVDLK